MNSKDYSRWVNKIVACNRKQRKNILSSRFGVMMISNEVRSRSERDFLGGPVIVVRQSSGKGAHSQFVRAAEVEEPVLTVHIVKRSKTRHLTKNLK